MSIEKILPKVLTNPTLNIISSCTIPCNTPVNLLNVKLSNDPLIGDINQ